MKRKLTPTQITFVYKCTRWWVETYARESREIEVYIYNITRGQSCIGGNNQSSEWRCIQWLAFAERAEPEPEHRERRWRTLTRDQLSLAISINCEAVTLSPLLCSALFLSYTCTTLVCICLYTPSTSLSIVRHYYFIFFLFQYLGHPRREPKCVQSIKTHKGKSALSAVNAK